MDKEKDKLEINKEYNIRNSGTVVYKGKDGNNGLNAFEPVKGNFSGFKISLTPYQVRLRIKK